MYLYNKHTLYYLAVLLIFYCSCKLPTDKIYPCLLYLFVNFYQEYQIHVEEIVIGYFYILSLYLLDQS